MARIAVKLCRFHRLDGIIRAPLRHGAREGGAMAANFAVLQLSGCAGCEVSLLNAHEWIGRRRLDYMPLVLSSEALPEVKTLLVSGAVRTEDLTVRAKPPAGLEAGRRHCTSARWPTWATAMCVPCSFRDGAPAAPHSARSIRWTRCRRPYLPGCPPTPELFMAALFDCEGFEASKTVCIECGRTKTRDRPRRLQGLTGRGRSRHLSHQPGYLCVGSSTRGGCRASAPVPGTPCGCRGWPTGLSRALPTNGLWRSKGVCAHDGYPRR